MCLFALTQKPAGAGAAKGKAKRGSVSNTQKLETFLSSCFEPGHLQRQLQLQQYEQDFLKSEALNAQESKRTAWR